MQRGRLQSLLEGVDILGEPARGPGYASGHPVVAVAALATVASRSSADSPARLRGCWPAASL